MAVNTNENIGQNSALADAMRQAGFSADNPNTKPNDGGGSPAKNTWSYHNNNSIGLTGGNSSEYYRTLYDELKKIFDTEAPDGTKFALIPITREQYQALRFSAFVVAVQKDAFPNYMAYHVVIVEATGEKLSAKIKKINNDEIIRVVPTTEAYDNKMRGIVQDRLRAVYPNVPAERMIQTPAEYIPSNFDTKSPEAIKRIAMTYALACSSKLIQSASKNAQRNIAHLDTTDSLVVKPQFYHNNVISDIYGCPLRADVFVTTQSQAQVVLDNNREQDINNLDRIVTVSEVAGFVEAIDAGPKETNQSGWGETNVASQYRRQRANFVISDAVINGNYSVSEVWMAILTATAALVTNNNWMLAFQPNLQSKNKLDLRDIGVLNYASNIFNDPVPEPIQTKDESKFGNADLWDFIQKVFYEGMYVSIDCISGAPNSWIFSIFRAAAMDNNDTAKETLYNALNALLDGKLAARFPYGGKMFIARQPIFNGSYLDAENNRVPLSNLDQIAIYNRLGSSDINYCRDWIATFTNQQAELAMRMSARYQMQNHLTNGTAEITHLGDRCFLNPQLLAVAMDIMKEIAGARFTIDSQNNQIASNTNKAIATFAQGAGLGSNVSFISGSAATNAVYPNYNQQSTAW